MRSTVLFLQRHSKSHSSHVAGLAEVQMLMVESKQSKGRLVAASSPSASPSSIVKRASLLKGSEECRGMDRIDLLDLKACIVKKVGTEKANRYFSHFRSFLSSRLSKVELDKVVLRTIGKENVGLHNQFVKAILTNAVKAKAPPPPLLPVQHAGKPPLKPHSPCITSEDIVHHASPSIMSNGDSILPLPSPCRGRSVAARDLRASPLGLREEHAMPDLSRPMQQFDEGAKQLGSDSISSLDHALKRARVIPPPSDESVTLAESGRHHFSLHRDDGVQILPPLPFGSSIKALLGAPFHVETGNGWQRPAFHAYPAHLLLPDTPDKEVEDSGDLPDNEMMHTLMDQVAITEGLEGVNRESAVILNLALDAYLRKLIKSCIDAPCLQAGAVPDLERSAETILSRDKIKEALLNMKRHRGMNGMSLGPIAEFLKKGKEKMHPSLSLTDFKAAMESNPRQLGENWPVQLEKISFRIFDQ